MGVLKPKKLKRNGSLDNDSLGSSQKEKMKKFQWKAGASRGIMGPKKTQGAFTRKASAVATLGGLHNQSAMLFESYNPKNQWSIFNEKKGSVASGKQN